MEVGFIGLGNMGAAMAPNLLNAGHRLTVYNRTRAKAEGLAAQGAPVAERGADACRGDILITMLADDAAVEAVLFGESGVGHSLPAGAMHGGDTRSCFARALQWIPRPFRATPACCVSWLPPTQSGPSNKQHCP